MGHLLHPFGRHFRVFARNLRPRVGVYAGFGFFIYAQLVGLLGEGQRIEDTDVLETLAVDVAEQARVTPVGPVAANQHVGEAVIVIIARHQRTERRVLVEVAATRVLIQTADMAQHGVLQHFELPVPLVDNQHIALRRTGVIASRVQHDVVHQSVAVEVDGLAALPEGRARQPVGHGHETLRVDRVHHHLAIQDGVLQGVRPVVVPQRVRGIHLVINGVGLHYGVVYALELAPAQVLGQNAARLPPLVLRRAVQVKVHQAVVVEVGNHRMAAMHGPTRHSS